MEDCQFCHSVTKCSQLPDAMLLKLLCIYMHMLISCTVVALRMCDTTDPSRAAELYIAASEMNVVRSHCLLLNQTCQQYKLY